jgi:hypothetical protein
MPDENGSGARGYVLFLWSPTGYTLKELEGEPPVVGTELEEGIVVTHIGSSPYPLDSRVCVYSMGKS